MWTASPLLISLNYPTGGRRSSEMGLCGLKTQQNKVAGVDLSTRHFTNGDIQVHVSKIASNQSISVSGKEVQTYACSV